MLRLDPMAHGAKHLHVIHIEEKVFIPAGRDDMIQFKSAGVIFTDSTAGASGIPPQEPAPQFPPLDCLIQ
jgi:hypothetical protein